MQGRVVAYEIVVSIGASVLVIDFDRNGIVARSGIYIGIGTHHGGAAKQLFDGDGTGIQFFLDRFFVEMFKGLCQNLRCLTMTVFSTTCSFAGWKVMV